MNCPKCKTMNLPGSNFCEKCGTDLKAAAKEAARPRPPARSSYSRGYRSPYTGYGANVRPTPAPVPRPAPLDAPRPSRSRSFGASTRSAAAPPLPPPQPSSPSPAPSRPSRLPQSGPPERPQQKERSRPSPFLTPPRNVGVPSPAPSSVSPPSRPALQPFARLEGRDETGFDLCYDENLIGRASPHEGIEPAVDLTRADRSGTVSRRHATIGRDDQAVYLEDLGSSNGTRLNGQTLRVGLQAPLNDGDEIVFGDLVFTFRSTRPA